MLEGQTYLVLYKSAFINPLYITYREIPIIHGLESGKGFNEPLVYVQHIYVSED